MRAMRFVTSTVLAAVLASMLAGCSSTNLTNLWVDDQPLETPLDNVLVIALDRNAESRRMWEDAIAAEFQSQGLLARQSYQLFPADLPDSQQVAVVLARDSHDAAIVTQRLNVVTNAGVESGYRDTPPAAFKNYWRRGYTVALTAATQPIAYDKDGKNKSRDQEARYQVDLARADGRLVWTGTTTPIKVTDPEKLRTEVAGQIVPELQKRKVISVE